MFGPMEAVWVGGLDEDGNVYYHYFGSEVVQKLASAAKDVGYCQSRREVYVLNGRYNDVYHIICSEKA